MLLYQLRHKKNRIAQIDAFLWPWMKSLHNTRESATPHNGGSPARLPAGSFIVDNHKSSAVHGEWDIRRAVHERTSKTPAEQSRSGVVYDKFVFSIIATRKPLRVLVSKVIPSILITSSAFAAESLTPDDAASRLAIIITLLLTAVVVHSDVTGSFEELTLAANYSICCLGILVLCTLEIAVAKVMLLNPWEDSTTAASDAAGEDTDLLDGYGFDFLMWQLLLGLWILANIGFAGRVAWLWRKRDRLLQRDEDHAVATTQPAAGGKKKTPWRVPGKREARSLKIN